MADVENIFGLNLVETAFLKKKIMWKYLGVSIDRGKNEPEKYYVRTETGVRITYIHVDGQDVFRVIYREYFTLCDCVIWQIVDRNRFVTIGVHTKFFHVGLANIYLQWWYLAGFVFIIGDTVNASFSVGINKFAEAHDRRYTIENLFRSASNSFPEMNAKLMVFIFMYSGLLPLLFFSFPATCSNLSICAVEYLLEHKRIGKS